MKLKSHCIAFAFFHIQVCLTNDFGRPFTDVVGRINWVAENYLVFFEISELIFQPESNERSIWPSEALQRAWGHLRAAMLHYFRHEGNADAASRGVRGEAAVNLRSYAQIHEALFGRKACTYNLHLILCGLAYQVGVWRGCLRGEASTHTRTCFSPIPS